MRILILAPQPFFQERGTPIAVRMLAEALAEFQYEVDLLVFHEGEDILMPGVSVHRSRGLPWCNNIRPGLSVKKLLCDAAMMVKAVSMGLRRRYDVIHAVEESAFVAWFLGLLTRTPYLFDMDSSMPEQIALKYRITRPALRLMDGFEAFAIRRSAGVVAVCKILEERARELVADLPIVCLGDVSLLDDGVEPEEDLRVSLNLDGKMALYVGNLESYQGIDLLVDSFALAGKKRERLHLVVIGGTESDIARYRERVSNLGADKQIHFVGPRPLKNLAGYLRQADLLVSPRSSGINTPMKLYSYLDSGRPVLGTRLPTHTQVLDDDIALLVGATPPEMADGIVRLNDDVKLRERLARSAKRRVGSEFSAAAYKRKLSEFYSQFEPGR